MIIPVTPGARLEGLPEGSSNKKASKVYMTKVMYPSPHYQFFVLTLLQPASQYLEAVRKQPEVRLEGALSDDSIYAKAEILSSMASGMEI